MKVFTIRKPDTATTIRLFENPGGMTYDISIVQGTGVRWEHLYPLQMVLSILFDAANRGYRITSEVRNDA